MLARPRPARAPPRARAPLQRRGRRERALQGKCATRDIGIRGPGRTGPDQVLLCPEGLGTRPTRGPEKKGRPSTLAPSNAHAHPLGPLSPTALSPLRRRRLESRSGGGRKRKKILKTPRKKRGLRGAPPLAQAQCAGASANLTALPAELRGRGGDCACAPPAHVTRQPLQPLAARCTRRVDVEGLAAAAAAARVRGSRAAGPGECRASARPAAAEMPGHRGAPHLPAWVCGECGSARVSSRRPSAEGGVAALAPVGVSAFPGGPRGSVPGGVGLWRAHPLARVGELPAGLPAAAS